MQYSRCIVVLAQGAREPSLPLSPSPSLPLSLSPSLPPSLLPSSEAVLLCIDDLSYMPREILASNPPSMHRRMKHDAVQPDKDVRMQA